MPVKHFAEIESALIQRFYTMLWCNIATVDGRHRIVRREG